MILDSVCTVETPEGVELQLHPAGVVARTLALLIDQALVGGLLMVAMPVLMLFGPAGMGVGFILLFLVQWLYPVLMEVLGDGRTVGKRALGLRVLRDNGLPITWGPSLLRNLLRFVDGLPFAYTVGLVSVMLTRHFQRVGDLVAGTLVVYDVAPTRIHAIPDVPPCAVPAGLTLEEQAGLLAFGERSPGLNPARAEELGDLLSGLTGASGEQGVQILQGMARHIRGAS